MPCTPGALGFLFAIEAVLGPFARGAYLLIGVSARDRAGNFNTRLPVDASVFVAPRNAELIVDEFGTASPDGNPVFAPASVARRAAWVATAESAPTKLLPLPSGDLSASNRFQLSRLQELRRVPTAFMRRDVDLSAFTRVDAPLVQLPSTDGSGTLDNTSDCGSHVYYLGSGGGGECPPFGCKE